jgi:hypothetical protein
MTLLSLQRDMSAWLDTGSEQCAARFAASTRPGLGIYQNNYRAQLAACLEDSFSVTLAWLGGAAFHDAIVAHVGSVPPTSWTLDLYGRDFPATLRALYPDDPEVGDLATIEWALSEAFVAPDAPPLAADLTTMDWDKARIGLVPSLTFHALKTNAPAIWSAIQGGSEPPAAILLPAPEALILWRSDELCRFRSIMPDERDALLFLTTPGATFGGLCAALGEGKVERIGPWLGQWLAEGQIASIADPA